MAAPGRLLEEEMTGGGWAGPGGPWRAGILSGKPPVRPGLTPWPGYVESVEFCHCGCRPEPGGTAASYQSSLSDGQLRTGHRWLHLSTSSCTTQPSQPSTVTTTSSAQLTGHQNRTPVVTSCRPAGVCLFVYITMLVTRQPPHCSTWLTLSLLAS